MDNAVEALEYAFAVFVFVIALSLSMYLLGQAKTTSDSMLASTNPDTVYSGEGLSDEEKKINGRVVYLTFDELNAKGRIVGVDTIIPTLYRDYKENYVIEFYTKDRKLVMRLDLSEENRRREIWTANPNTDVKKRLDILISSKYRGAKVNLSYNKTEYYDGIINNQGYNRENDYALNTVKHPIVSYTVDEEGNAKQITKDYNEESVKNACNEISKNGLYSYCKGRQFVEEYAYLLSEDDESTRLSNERLTEKIDKIIIRYVEK